MLPCISGAQVKWTTKEKKMPKTQNQRPEKEMKLFAAAMKLDYIDLCAMRLVC